MPYGYNGKILHVNLTDASYEIEEPAENFFRTYFGGGGIAAYYLLKDLKPGTDPLSPENILVVSLSVVTGAPLSGFSRYTFAAKSPLTGGFAETEAGGYFGPEMKFSGFDAVIIKGKAEKPVYLWLKDGQVEIRDAANIWDTLSMVYRKMGRLEEALSAEQQAVKLSDGLIPRYKERLEEIRKAMGRKK